MTGHPTDDGAPIRNATTSSCRSCAPPTRPAPSACGCRSGSRAGKLLERLLPVLHDLDLVLFEEAQGQQTPQAQPDAFDAIAALDDPHVRVLLDISMLMPSLPESYIDVLRRGGVDEALVEQLSTAWRAPETHDAVLAAVRAAPCRRPCTPCS